MVGVDLGVNNVAIVGEPVAFGTGFFVFLFLCFSAFIAQYFLTYAHEGGHLLALVATFRRILGYWIEDSANGLTTFEPRKWAVSNLVVGVAGYLAPPLLGLGGAALIASGNPFAVLLIGAVFSLLALFPARSPLAFAIPLLVLLGIGAALIWGSDTTQAAVAVSLVWFLLIGGIFDTFTLPAGGGDASIMAGKTLIPGLIWKIAWVFVAIVALIVGGQLLLRPGYAIS
jgi:Peptidase M50B-like